MRFASIIKDKKEALLLVAGVGESGVVNGDSGFGEVSIALSSELSASNSCFRGALQSQDESSGNASHSLGVEPSIHKGGGVSTIGTYGVVNDCL